MTDLDELDKKMAAGTQGEWLLLSRVGSIVSPSADEICVYLYRDKIPDGEVIVALHNAYPALSAELRAAGAVCAIRLAELERSIQKWGSLDSALAYDYYLDEAEIEALKVWKEAKKDANS